MKIANHIISILLVFILLLHTNYVAFYYALYEINMESLTESCCTKVKVDCNAHCYFDMKINESNDNESSPMTVEQKLKFYEYDISHFEYTIQIGNRESNFADNAKNCLPAFVNDIDHPPNS